MDGERHTSADSAHSLWLIDEKIRGVEGVIRLLQRANSELGLQIFVVKAQVVNHSSHPQHGLARFKFPIAIKIKLRFLILLVTRHVYSGHMQRQE